MFPKIMLAIYLAVFTYFAFDPFEREVWFAENLPVWTVVISLILIYIYYHKFSNLAIALMSIFIIMHTIGGHYTFARVPFDWFTDFFGFERNHYDRIAHFSVGLYAFGLAEMFRAKRVFSNTFVLLSYPIFAILAIAALYEIFEWQFALLADPNAGAEVLGSQGDVWDAQKDMLLDGLGALFAMSIFCLLYRGSLLKDEEKE